MFLLLASCADPRSELPPRSIGTHSEPPPGTEDVLLVVFDDLGTNGVGAYDPSAPPTPVLDALAAEGIAFLDAWATPLCAPSRATLLTGRYPSRTGVGMVPEFAPAAPGAVPLPLSEVVIPEILPPTWSTGAVGKWHVGGYQPGAERDPLEQGFDSFEGSVGNLDYPSHVHGYFSWVKDDDGALVDTTTYATTDSADDAIARIAEMPEPWFLYLAFNAPHSPYEAPPSDLAVPAGNTYDDLYRAMITAADAELGRVLASMRPGLRARTTVIALGDNGQPDDLLLPGSDRMKYTAYEGGVRVPLIVAGPRVVGRGTTSALVDLSDVLPTIAEIAGVDPGDVDGRSFLPVLTDPDARIRDFAYTEAFWDDTERTWAVRDERYKLLVTEDWPYGPDGLDTASLLFDLQADPRERTDLSADPAHAADLARLTAAADAIRGQ